MTLVPSTWTPPTSRPWPLEGAAIGSKFVNSTCASSSWCTWGSIRKKQQWPRILAMSPLRDSTEAIRVGIVLINIESSHRFGWNQVQGLQGLWLPTHSLQHCPCKKSSEFSIVILIIICIWPSRDFHYMGRNGHHLKRIRVKSAPCYDSAWCQKISKHFDLNQVLFILPALVGDLRGPALYRRGWELGSYKCVCSDILVFFDSLLPSPYIGTDTPRKRVIHRDYEGFGHLANLSAWLYVFVC